MGLKKIEQLLKEKKITKAEYDRRVSQRAASLKGGAKGRKVKKAKRANNMPVVRSRGTFTTSVARVSPVQNALNKALISSETKEILAYAATLVAPEHYSTRIPDAYPKQSALYKSSREFEIPMVPSTNADDEGRFAICVQPKIGPSGSMLEAYSILVVDPSITYASANWASASTYLTETVDGVVLYRDPQFKMLTLGSTNGPPVQWFTYPNPTDFVYPSAGEFNLARMYDAGVGRIDRSSIDDFRTTGLGTGAENFILPTVDYDYTLYVVSSFRTGAGQSAWTAATFTGNVSIDGSSSSLTSITNTTDLNSTTSGFRHNVSSASISAGSEVEVHAEYNFTGTAPTSAQWIGVQIMMVPVEEETTVSAGLITAIRPVACSVLATWRGEILHNAGNISAAIGTTDSLNKNWLTNTPNAGWQPQKWETYAVVPDVDGNIYHSGPIDKGAYVWWKPAKEEDTFWRTLPEMEEMDYPPMFVAGRYVTTSGDMPATVLRCRIETVYEYQTSSPLISTKATPRHAEALVRTLTILDQIGLRSATENPFHLLLPFLAKLGIGAFLSKAAGVAGTAVAGALGSAKLSYGSKTGFMASIGGN